MATVTFTTEEANELARAHSAWVSYLQHGSNAFVSTEGLAVVRRVAAMLFAAMRAQGLVSEAADVLAWVEEMETLQPEVGARRFIP